MAPVMMKLKDLDDFEDAQLMKQKVAACFTAFVHDIDSAISLDGEFSSEGTIENDEQQKLTPSTIEHLPTGKTISFANPPAFQNYKEFTSSHLRGAATGVGLSYEIFGDLSEINFSSGRMGWIEMNRNIDTWREQIIIKPFLNEAIKDFKLMMYLTGKKLKDSSFNHISPRREMIDPLKEMLALEKQMRNGVVSRSEVTASLGRDPEEVMRQIAKDADEADKNGLVFDSDPRKVSQAGKTQIESTGGTNAE
jgi:lambda family phage portal protein